MDGGERGEVIQCPAQHSRHIYSANLERFYVPAGSIPDAESLADVQVEPPSPGSGYARLENDEQRDVRENPSSGEADILTEAIARAHAEALECVDYKNEDTGGTGMTIASDRSRELKALLLNSVIEDGVGRWEEKVHMRVAVELSIAVCKMRNGTFVS